MGKFYRILFVIILISSAIVARSQDLITGDYTNYPFHDFAKKIEKETDYKFYYNPAWMDSVLVNLRVKEKPLEVVLNVIFHNTDLRFIIDPSHQVIITKGQELMADLPEGFFDVGNGPSAEYNSSMLSFGQEEEAEKLRTSIENKLFEIGIKTRKIQEGSANLAGYIRDASSGEAVVGAVVYIEDPWTGVASDQFGYYSITLPRGRHEMKIKSVGMKSTKRQIILYSDGKLDINLEQDIIPLKEVVIESEKDVNVRGIQMGLDKLDISTMKQIPLALGETDVMKVALTLPGVQSVGEGASGFNVRGGAVDQNLMLINDAPIFNSSHLFGFFSIFNPDVIKSVELYKSGIPAQYGGRISSVFEVKSRDGNKKKITGTGGISPITSRFMLEGPIIKDKSSFIIGARTTYSDWLLKKIPDASIKNSTASFYDLNARITHEFSDKDALYLSGYYSNDKFKLNSDSLYNYNNQNASLQWKHNFNNKLYGVTTAIFSQYSYNIKDVSVPVNSFELGYKINEGNFKLDFSYFPSSEHKIDFGYSGIYYDLNPGSYQPLGSESLIKPIQMENEYGLENAVYLGDKFDINQKISLYAGLRYSFYQYLGPHTVYVYPEGFPRKADNVSDTLYYGNRQVISHYGGPEYRFSARYNLDDNSSLKLSFNRLRQYIHMLSNTTAISPTDTWKLSDRYIRPEIGDQFSLGYYRNLRQNSVEFSVEAYYKLITDILDFKDGAQLLLNQQIETDLVSGKGEAYGVEFLLKKKIGKLNGWISYTYSRTLIKVDGDYPEETLNKGKYYPASYDKPHDLSVITNFKFNRRFSTSVNFTYSTGRPITFPVAKYDLGNTRRIHYSERNQYRIPDYMRLDLSFTLEGNHKIHQWYHNSWTISVYNLLGRDNVYSIYFVTEGTKIQGYKLSIFAQAIPTITFNFRF